MPMAVKCAKMHIKLKPTAKPRRCPEPKWGANGPYRKIMTRWAKEKLETGEYVHFPRSRWASRLSLSCARGATRSCGPARAKIPTPSARCATPSSATRRRADERRQQQPARPLLGIQQRREHRTTRRLRRADGVCSGWILLGRLLPCRHLRCRSNAPPAAASAAASGSVRAAGRPSSRRP